MDRRPSTFLSYAAALAMGFASSGAVAGEAPKGGSATSMSAYADYAKEITAECVRNQAYGIGTGGMKLTTFCTKLGTEQAIKKHDEMYPERATAGAIGVRRPPMR